ncbi:MAG: PspC domain-containing protein [Alistipes sp.]|nr:PspC domain-containing protein [Alistipes sp.]
MKETINVNIAQQAFTMDMDAYSTLTTYLEDIGRRLSPSDTETLSDIEARIAELFREKVPSPMMVVTYSIVRGVMSQIGEPELFGEAYRPMSDHSGNRTFPGEQPRKLLRPRTNRSVAGVCSGMANYFNVDVTLIRIVFIVGFFAGFSTVLLYIILWAVVAQEPVTAVTNNNSNPENKA